jgi:hypothetical protein
MVAGHSRLESRYPKHNFYPQFVQTINNIQLVPSTEPDVLHWLPATNGKCTSKSTYIYLQQQQNHSLPSLGSRAISSHTHNILNRIWKAKTIPPLLKTFSWRLFRHALLTADRAGRFSTNIDKLCTVCNQIENDAHLFFLCQLPQ